MPLQSVAVQPIDPTALSPSAETQLSDLLSQGTALALQRGVAVLSASFDPADRSMAHLLKAQQAMIGTMINSKVRVDEATLKLQRDESRENRIANIIEGIKEANAIAKELDAQGGHDDGGELEGPRLRRGTSQGVLAMTATPGGTAFA